MKDTLYRKRYIYLILFFIGYTSSLYAMEGAGVYFKASLCGKIYKRFSFLVEEDIRPRDDFKEAEWFLTTVEINYRLNKYLLAGGGYMSLARYKASDELRNRYYLYATGTYSIGRFSFALRERFQSTYKVHAEHPKNYLRSMLTLSYKMGKLGLEPFVYAEVFNDTQNQMRSDKIRFSAGSNYRLNAHNTLQLYYRYHIFNVTDPVNYRNAIGVCYTHRF